MDWALGLPSSCSLLDNNPAVGSRRRMPSLGVEAELRRSAGVH